jgi:hypothetical protein
MAKIRALFIVAVIASMTGTQVRPAFPTANAQPGNAPIVADDGGKVGPTGG